MGSRGSIYDPAGDSSDCGERGEIMGGNGMKRAVLTAQTRQENIQDESRVHPSPLPSKPRKGIKVFQLHFKMIKIHIYCWYFVIHDSSTVNPRDIFIFKWLHL